MANDPAFLFYPGDYLRDTQCLSEKAQVAYDRIMCEHMRNICISQTQLDFFTKRLTVDEKQELLMVLAPVKGGFHIPWVTESITKRREYSESRRKNREGAKEKKPKNISKSYVPHMENENEIVNENTIEDKIKSAFDDLMMESIRSTFPKHDIKNELSIFLLKVRGSPTKYTFHEVNGLRQAFIYQLKNSTSTNGIRTTTKGTSVATTAIIEPGKDFGVSKGFSRSGSNGGGNRSGTKESAGG